MSRSIRFRAWDKKARTMREVLNLEFNEVGEVSEITVKVGEAAPIPPNANDEDCSVLAGIPCDSGSDKFELFQFTGLLDKNGKEIYEGDVVVDRFDPYKRGEEFVGAITIEPTRGVVVGGAKGVWPHDIEVIGNIYEHSHILTNKT